MWSESTWSLGKPVVLNLKITNQTYIGEPADWVTKDGLTGQAADGLSTPISKEEQDEYDL